MNTPLFSVWFCDRFQTFEVVYNPLFFFIFPPDIRFQYPADTGRKTSEEDTLYQSYLRILLPPGRGTWPILGVKATKVSRWGFETLTLYRTKNPKIHTLFRKTTSTEHTAELVRVLQCCPGGTPKNSWWGCIARFSKSWPFFRQICS